MPSRAACPQGTAMLTFIQCSPREKLPSSSCRTAGPRLISCALPRWSPRREDTSLLTQSDQTPLWRSPFSARGPWRMASSPRRQFPIHGFPGNACIYAARSDEASGCPHLHDASPCPLSTPPRRACYRCWPSLLRRAPRSCWCARMRRQIFRWPSRSSLPPPWARSVAGPIIWRSTSPGTPCPGCCDSLPWPAPGSSTPRRRCWCARRCHARAWRNAEFARLMLGMAGSWPARMGRSLTWVICFKKILPIWEGLAGSFRTNRKTVIPPRGTPALAPGASVGAM